MLRQQTYKYLIATLFTVIMIGEPIAQYFFTTIASVSQIEMEEKAEEKAEEKTENYKISHTGDCIFSEAIESKNVAFLKANLYAEPHQDQADIPPEQVSLIS